MQTINTFSKGMNTDVDLSLMDKDQYLYSENFRLFTKSGSTLGSLENILGNELLSTSSVIPNGYNICGYCAIRDELYLFITTNSSATPTSGFSRIIKLIFNNQGTSISSSSTIYNDGNSSDGSRLLLSTANKIKAVGRYESDTIKKIYWVDGYNNLRFANVATISSTQPANKFEIIPNFNLSTPLFSSFTSGSLTSGKVQYAYQMYDLNGGETIFSPTSPLISLSTTSGQTGSNKTFKGSDIDVNTGKGVKISITPPSGFNRIRVVSIKYNSINGIPTINIIADQSISSTPSLTYFVDTGINYLGSYTYEQFSIIGNNVFSASEIETKNDYLFAANISQTDWDIDYDARAYRFLSATDSHGSSYYRKAYLHNTSFTDTPFIINGASSPSTWNVPATHGCINSYNEILNSNPSYIFKYQSDGLNSGGTGVNVSYSFTVRDLIITSTGTNYLEEYSNNTDYSNVVEESNYVGYQRDEIYRFGIVFFNEKGQSSTVKWIGDIRMPSLNDPFGQTEAYLLSNPTEVHSSQLGIIFSVNTSSAVSQGAKYFKIVRVQRNKEDRSILAQGIVGAVLITQFGTPSTNYYSLPNLTPLFNTTYSDYYGSLSMEKSILEFISPEVNFNKNIDYQSGDIIEAVGYYSDIHITPLTPGQGQVVKAYSITPFSTSDKAYQIVNFNSIVNFINEYEPSGAAAFSTYFTKYNVDLGVATKFLNTTRMYLANRDNPSGTKLIVRLNGTLGGSGLLNKVLLCNYRRPINNSQYGGLTYQARLNNTYISCGDIYYCNGSIVNTSTFGGDTYVGMYDYLRTIVIQNTPTFSQTIQNILYFPIETSINLRFREDNCYSKMAGTTLNKYLLNEYAGTYNPTWSGADPSEKLVQLTDLYKYNSVYSQQDTTFKYFPKSDTITSNHHNYDTRVLVSDLKINGELSDSWTKFKLDNFLDVDSTYGGITDLKNYKNVLYFWQPKGFGALSVNQRSLLQDNNAGQLVLGTGGVLDRYDYISNVDGCSFRYSVVAGLKGLYWLDLNNKCITRYDGGVEGISKIKGVNSLLHNINKYTLTNSSSVYDKNNNEVLFQIYHIKPTESLGTIEMLSYNELMDSFNGIYTYSPDMLISTNNTNYLSTKIASNGQILYLHNVLGEGGMFYNTYYPSKLSIVVNDNYQETKTFDMLEFTTLSNFGVNKGYNYINDTFTSIRVYNDYQNSDFQTITMNNIGNQITANLTRKERGFKLAIPRNIVVNSADSIFSPSNLDTTRSFKERIRNKYAIIDLIYNSPSYSINFNIPYIITNYRISKR